MNRPNRKSSPSRRSFLKSTAAAASAVPLAIVAAPKAEAVADIDPSPGGVEDILGKPSLPFAEMCRMTDLVESQLAPIDAVLREMETGSFDRNGPGDPDTEPYDVEITLHDELGSFVIDSRQPIAAQFVDGLEDVALRLLELARAIRESAPSTEDAAHA